MCAKKKRSLPKQWKIAGESLPTSRLSPSENAIFEEAFDTYRGLVTKGHGTSSPRFLVPAEELKTRRSAALSMTEFLCDRYRDTFDRETVLRVLSIAAALPGSTADWYADSPGFLLGAALWLLDYLEDNCWEEDHFDLLPECHADELESRLPSVNDLNHSRSDILGLVTVLLGRKKEQRRSYRLLLDMVDVETVSELKTAFRNALLDHFERAASVYRPVPSDEQPPLPFTQGNIAAMRQEPPLQRQPELDFLLMAPNLIGRSYEDAKRSLGTAKAGKLMCEITTKDPYALCAAYLLLERDGDVLAHLHMLTAGVLACAYRHLPWGCGDLVMEVLPYEEGTPDHTLRYPYHGSLYDWDADDAGEDGKNTRTRERLTVS